MLAVFDSGLETLRLPLVKPVSLTDEDGQPISEVRRENVAFLVQRYFEWTGTIEEGTCLPSSSHSSTHALQMR